MTRRRSPLKHRPLLIAHRGDSTQCPENTHAAFTAALAAGVDAIELDVRLSAEGTAIVCHDANLARFGGPHTSLRTMSLAEIQCVDIGRWKGHAFRGAQVLTLTDVLALCRSVVLCIELKASAGVGASAYHRRLVTAVITTIRAQQAQKRVQLLCFHSGVLRLCAQQAPEIKRVRNCERLPQQVNTWLRQQRGCYALCFDRRLITVSLVAAAQEQGLKVFAYTANTQALVKQLVQCGVDGVLSDRPAWLVKTMRTL